METMDVFKPTITISTKQFPDLPQLPIGGTGTLEVRYEVVGINKYDGDEMGSEEDTGEYVEYRLEIDVVNIKDKKMSLEEAGERASSQPLLTKNSINPAP